MLRVSISRLRAGLRAALEAFLELLLVPRRLGRRLSADDERHQQLADPVSLEVEIDRHARTLAVIERLDRTLNHPPDGAIDTANGPAVRRIQLAQLDRHCPVSATDSAGDDNSRARDNRAFALPAHADNALLPIRQMPWIGHVGENVFGATGYLDALHDWGHLASFVTISVWIIPQVSTLRLNEDDEPCRRCHA